MESCACSILRFTFSSDVKEVGASTMALEPWFGAASIGGEIAGAVSEGGEVSFGCCVNMTIR